MPRKEGRDKVTGRARYVGDLAFPGMLYGVTVRSSVPRGRIRGIHFEPGIPWTEFTIVTAKDIPGKNCVALLIEDQPALADEIVNHPEEPVLLLAHLDKYLLEEARRAVRIEIDALPALFTIDDALARKQIIWGEDNIFKSFHVEKGNVDEIWSTADFVVEGEYETGAQEQLYIEPQGMIAQASPADGVTKPSCVFSACRKSAFASCKPKPAAASAARKNIPPCWPPTPRCSPGSLASP